MTLETKIINARYGCRNASSLEILKACDEGKINNVKIDNQDFILIDEKLENWSPEVDTASSTFEKKGDVTIFHLGKSFNFYHKEEVEKELLAEIEKNRSKFIFHFSEEPNIDSSGIAVLTRAALYAISQQNRVQVINIGETRKNIFALTKLEKVMDFPANIDEAMKNLEK